LLIPEEEKEQEEEEMEGERGEIFEENNGL
jgi:hypothetical protein